MVEYFLPVLPYPVMSLHRLMSLWFYTSRPLLYPLVPLIFALGYQAGGGSLADWSLLEWLFVLALTWPFGMIIYGINDIYDADIDAADARRSRLEGGQHKGNEQKYIWWGVGVAVVALTIMSVIAYGTYGLLFAQLAVLASVTYSVPPLRLKSRPGLDVLFSGVAYVVFVYGAGYWLMQPYAPLPDAVYVLAIFAACLHALGALRDYTVDKTAGATTIAVQFGPRVTALLVVIASLLGMYIWYLERGIDIAGNLVFLSILLPALLTIKKPNEQLIRLSMRVVAFVVGLVGLYKIFF